MRHCVLVLLALPVLASAFAPGALKAPALRNGFKAPFARRQSGLKLARGAGRAERLQAAALKMVKDSGNAVHYEPFLGLEERDACGVGFVANRNGDRNHDIVHKVSSTNLRMGHSRVRMSGNLFLASKQLGAGAVNSDWPRL